MSATSCEFVRKPSSPSTAVSLASSRNSSIISARARATLGSSVAPSSANRPKPHISQVRDRGALWYVHCEQSTPAHKRCEAHSCPTVLAKPTYLALPFATMVQPIDAGQLLPPHVCLVLAEAASARGMS